MRISDWSSDVCSSDLSAAMVALRQAIERVAPTNSRVLVSGPAGAGKELVARLIHQRSRRAGGPFVVLNVAALMPDRMDQELFGIEEAASKTGKAVAIKSHHNVGGLPDARSEEHTSELQSLMRIPSSIFCL